MPKFTYKARNKAGEIKAGLLEESTEKNVRKKLEEDGLSLISLREESAEKKIGFEFFLKFFPVPAIEIITFVHLLAVMVKAGMPLSKSLAALSKQTKNEKFGKIITAVSKDISKGNTFADALAKHPDVFDELFINMVRVGELSGTLDSVLSLLAEQMKKDYELKSKVKGAMIYPAVILMVMFAVGIVVMVYVIPKMTAVFESLNVQLPASTRFMIALSSLIRNYGLLIFGAIIFLGTAAKMLLRGKSSSAIDKLIIKSPIIGEISKKINIARFARTTSSLVRGGVSISTALKTVSKTLSNHYYQKSIADAAEKIEKGLSLKEILEGYGDLYPPLVLQMIEVGEETGSLDDILMDLAEFYEGEVSEMTKNLSTIIEPILMVVMGIAVGFFAISIIQPMYSIGEAI